MSTNKIISSPSLIIQPNKLSEAMVSLNSLGLSASNKLSLI